MRTDLTAPAVGSYFDRRGVAVTLYRSGGPRELLAGTAGDELDLTPYIERASHSHEDVRLSLSHGGELVGAARPAPGQVISITADGDVLFNAVIESLTGEVEERGTRSFSITARRRDAFPWWRDVRRVSEIWGAGSDLGRMAETVAEALDLSDAEYVIGSVGISLAHDSAQLADVNGWEMLTLLLQPALLEPFVDALGVLKPISRNVRRSPTMVLTLAQVVRIEMGSARPSVTGVRVTWLDPMLTRVAQEDQSLTEAQMVCGFFSPNPSRDVWWSKDRLQRAENCRMVVRSSVNAGSALFGIPVGTESFVVTSEFGGVVSCQLGPWVPIVTGAALIAFATLAFVPDLVVTVGFLGSAGSTIPVGRLAQQVALNIFLMGLMTQGQHISEIYGTPYDYVHAENETESYDESAPEYVSNVEELRNDFIPDEVRAQGLAINELLYLARASNRDRVVIVDDPRVEPGDLLELPDGRTFYVTGYQRSLTRGDRPELSLEGFFL